MIFNQVGLENAAQGAGMLKGCAKGQKDRFEENTLLFGKWACKRIGKCAVCVRCFCNPSKGDRHWGEWKTLGLRRRRARGAVWGVTRQVLCTGGGHGPRHMTPRACSSMAQASVSGIWPSARRGPSVSVGHMAKCQAWPKCQCQAYGQVPGMAQASVSGIWPSARHGPSVSVRHGPSVSVRHMAKCQAWPKRRPRDCQAWPKRSTQLVFILRRAHARLNSQCVAPVMSVARAHAPMRQCSVRRPSALGRSRPWEECIHSPFSMHPHSLHRHMLACAWQGVPEEAEPSPICQPRSPPCP